MVVGLQTHPTPFEAVVSNGREASQLEPHEDAA
jgi:hypothetical protein